MPKSFHKHKILLDEHLYHRRFYPTLNEHFDVKHIKDDLRHGGMDDGPNYFRGRFHSLGVVNVKRKTAKKSKSS